MKWGYHDALIRAFTDYQKVSAETILQWYHDEVLCEKLNIAEKLYRKYSLENPAVFIDDLEWVVKNMQQAVFKRIQSPPIIILSKSSFGFDLRESQLCIYKTKNYLRLKEMILNGKL
jgi:NAD+ synthase (glutamine-hydrolysing)